MVLQFVIHMRERSPPYPRDEDNPAPPAGAAQRSGARTGAKRQAHRCRRLPAALKPKLGHSFTLQATLADRILTRKKPRISSYFGGVL